MAPGNWTTLAQESCTNYLTTDAGKSGKVTTTWEDMEKEETHLAVPAYSLSEPSRV